MNKHIEIENTAKLAESHTHEKLWSAARAGAKSLFRKAIEITPGKVEHVTLTEMMGRRSSYGMYKNGATESGEFVFYPSDKGSASLAPICWEEFSFSEFASLRDSDGKIYTATPREDGVTTIRVVTVDLERD